jgi:hypothetical protein
MILHEIEQGTEEWFSLRAGKFTGTNFATVASGIKTALKDSKYRKKGDVYLSDTLETLVYKKAAERVTGVPIMSSYTNQDMERGKLLESEARSSFSDKTGLEVCEIGFIEFDEFTGVSPDGIIFDSDDNPIAGLEIKCKDQHTHLKTLLHGDNSYKWQIQSSLYCSGFEKWYFVSYCPHYEENNLFIKEWYPDKLAFEKIEIGLDKSKELLNDILENYYGITET